MEMVWERFNENTVVLMTLFLILTSGFLITRLTNVLKMPRVSGYIIAGVIIGPCVLHLIPEVIAERMGFVSDIALAFIAFGVGRFFKRDVLRRTGKEIIFITVSEAMAAGILITLSMHFLFRLSWEFSLILGAIATATAPASTMMTINQYKAKGEMVNTLLQVVALDDVVCLLAFSAVSAWVNGRESGNFSVVSMVIPILWNLGSLVLGAVCGVILSKLLTPQRSRDNRLILVIAMLCGLSGICSAADISPLLSCMVFGAVYINLTKDKKLYRQINHFTPPVMSVFFIVSGMNLDLTSFRTVGIIGVAYFFIRIAGKYAGTYISCKLSGKSPEICRYMGLALVPQAGVAIGLAFLGKRLLPPQAGELVMTIVLSSSVLYELVGPVCAKKALILSGTISRERLLASGELPPEQAEEDTGAAGRTGKKERNLSGSRNTERKKVRRTVENGKKPDIRNLPGKKKTDEQNTAGKKKSPEKSMTEKNPMPQKDQGTGKESGKKRETKKQGNSEQSGKKEGKKTAGKKNGENQKTEVRKQRWGKKEIREGEKARA